MSLASRRSARTWAPKARSWRRLSLSLSGCDVGLKADLGPDQIRPGRSTSKSGFAADSGAEHTEHRRTPSHERPCSSRVPADQTPGQTRTNRFVDTCKDRVGLPDRTLTQNRLTWHPRNTSARERRRHIAVSGEARNPPPQALLVPAPCQPKNMSSGAGVWNKCSCCLRADAAYPVSFDMSRSNCLTSERQQH